jgi:uncharacterized protein
MASQSKWVRVGKVSYGKGVFAASDLPSGLELGEVAGRVIDDAEYVSSYCIDLGGTLSLEPRAPFRYLNHSCEPNCQLVHQLTEFEDGSPPQPSIYVETLKPIPAGAELTIDYSWSADGAIPCLCGAASCRGWVVDPAELHLLAPKKPKRPRTATPRSTAAAGSQSSAVGTRSSRSSTSAAAAASKGATTSGSAATSTAARRRPR